MSPVDSVEEAPRLSLPAQTYVVTVAVVAAVTVTVDSQPAWWALIVLGLPFSLVAMWVGFYAGLTVGFVMGDGPDAMSLPVQLTWVAVWAATAWINARLVEKLRRRGWNALRVNPPRRDEDDEPAPW
jgi:hypothetical protein